MNLENLSTNLKKLNSIKILNVKRNKINTFPPELNDLKNLKEIDLSDNEFTKFPENLLSLEAIETINLSMNHLDKVTISTKNQKIKYLYLSHNQIKEIPPDILNLSSLKHIAFNENYISEFKETIFEKVKNRKFFIDIANQHCPTIKNNKYGNLIEIPLQEKKDVELHRRNSSFIDEKKPVSHLKEMKKYKDGIIIFI